MICLQEWYVVSASHHRQIDRSQHMGPRPHLNTIRCLHLFYDIRESSKRYILSTC
ncbi:hypothetical protein X975_16153, partial [Stegodyphus mimosarum]